MNTISRNPVQSFKEGRKIIKAQDGTYLGQPVYKRDFLGTSYYLKDEKGNIVPGMNILRSQLDTKKMYSTGNAKGIIYKGADGKLYQNGREVYKRTTPSESQQTMTEKQADKQTTVESNSQNASSTIQNNSTQNKPNNGGSTNNKPVNNKGIAGGNTSFKTAFKTAFNNARNSGLQEFTWNGKRFNTKKAGEENYIWQNGNWVNPKQNALTFKPLDNPSLELPKAPEMTPNNLAGTTGNTSVLGGIYTPGVSINGISTIQNDIQNMNLPTYNRRGVRDYLRQLGFNPYSFNGAQRRALRMILNNTGDSTDSAIVQGMGLFKQGGSINNKQSNLENMNKFQDGGAMQANPQQQIMALVQAAMQGDQEAQSTIQQIQQAAQQGDQQASQMLQMIQGVMQQMQGQAQMAKRGAKLNYINRLKGNCPEGYQMNYFKVGGKVCRQCQKMETPKASCGKKMVKKGCSGMVKGIRAEMGAKLESMKKGGSTAFGDRSHTPASTNAQGRFGGRKAFNEYGTHKHPKVTRNVFSAFGDEGKKKPTNVGLVGHHATGNTGLMRTKETAKNNKHTAFGAAVARFHKGAKPTSKGGITTIKGAPKGKSHDGGLKKVTKNAFGGLLLIK